MLASSIETSLSSLTSVQTVLILSFKCAKFRGLLRHTLLLIYAYKKELQGVKSEKRGAHFSGALRPSHLVCQQSLH